MQLRFFMLIGLLVSLLSFNVTASAFSVSWETADHLYEQRLNNRANIAKARNAYLHLLPTLKTAQDKIRAVSQLGRLAIYEGEMILPKTAYAERKAIFSQCWDGFVEHIHPSKVGKHVAYYYFKGVCLSYWSEASGTFAALRKVSTVLDLLKNGMAADTRFEGGGMYRLAAGIYSNTKASPLGLYKPEVALQMIDKALKTRPYPGDPHAGANWFDNWYGRAFVLRELGRKTEAKKLLQAKIAELEELKEFDELPKGRAAEAIWCLGAMKAMLRSL